MRRMVSTVLGAATNLIAPIRWVNRLSGKQAAGLFLVVLWFVPAIPTRAADPGPAAPTSSGGQVPTASNAAVSGNTGTFTTGVEIDMPPGRSGMAPKLSLGYASGGGNGPLGVGWNLPMSSIARVGFRKGVPGRTIDFARDEFYLNLNGSSSRLIPVAIPGVVGDENCSVSYQIKGQTNSYCVRRYHTEMESWSKVEAYFGQVNKDGVTPTCSGVSCTSDPKNLQFWVVTSKTGMEMYFGVEDSAKITDPVVTTSAYAWYLVRSKDAHGNAIDYAYTNGKQSKGVLYYDTISYTAYDGNPGYKNAFDSLNATFAVHFTLRPRSDFAVSYRGGFPQVLGELYDTISVSPNNSTSTLTFYRMVYKQSTKTSRNLLAQVRHCGSQTQCDTPLPQREADEYPNQEYFYRGESTQLQGWDNISYGSDQGFTQGAQFIVNDTVGTHDWGSRLVDINGDGLPDAERF